jgi:hypothetical protein
VALYTPTDWEDLPSQSTPIDAAGLNHMEAGIAAASTAITSGLLAARPSAAAGTGGFYYATDQDVLSFSNGSAWQRLGLPAGATTMWYSTTAPMGWVKYDGSALGGSTGIYADLYAHLGTTTTPDTRGRTLVSLGTNADVSALGASDGLAVGSRTPVHNSANSLTLPNHTHALTDPGHTHGVNVVGTAGLNGATPQTIVSTNLGTNSTETSNSATTGITIGNPTTNPAIAGTIGPGGTRPTDTPAYITFILIAKL